MVNAIDELRRLREQMYGTANLTGSGVLWGYVDVIDARIAELEAQPDPLRDAIDELRDALDSQGCGTASWNADVARAALTVVERAGVDRG